MPADGVLAGKGLEQASTVRREGTGREFYFEAIRAGSIWTLSTMRRQDGKASTVYRVDTCATLAAAKDEAKALNRRLNRAGT